MEAKELRSKIDAQMAAAQAVEDGWNAKPESKTDAMPKELQDQMAAHYGKVDELRAQLDLENRKADHSKFMNDPEAPATASRGNWRNAAPGEGDEDIDPKSWREITVKTMQFSPAAGAMLAADIPVRYHVPLAVQGKGYSPAHEAYLRKGRDQMGPNDLKTLSEGLDSAGGFLVPEDYQTELIKKIMTMATVRARARLATTSRDMAQWPKINYTTDDKYTSGVRVTWTGELPATSTAHRVTDPQMGLYSVPIHTMMASLPMSNNLVEDAAFDIIGVSTDLLAEAAALDENDAFITGSGIGRPMGILTQVDGDGPASVVSGTAATLTADGVINLAYALPAQYETGAAFLMAKQTEKVIRQLKATDNTYLWPVWPQFGNFAPAPRQLLDYPVMRDEFVPAVSAGAYPIIFGDFKGYLVLDRVGMSIQRLTDSAYAELNLTGLLLRKRVGGQIIEPWRLKVQKVAAS